MKRIHFDDLRKLRYWIVLLILSLILIVIGLVQPFEFEYRSIYAYISLSGFLLQFIFLSKLFWHKNTVQWNKKGIVIRIKSILGSSLLFSDIKSVDLHQNILTLNRSDGSNIQIDLNEIEETDTLKLKEIIIENSISNTSS